MKKLFLISILIVTLISISSFAYADEQGFLDGGVSVEIGHVIYKNDNIDSVHNFQVMKRFYIFGVSVGAKAVDFVDERIRMFPVGIHLISESDTNIKFGVDLSYKYVSIRNYDNETFYVSKGFIKFPITDGAIILSTGYQDNDIYDGILFTIGIERKF